MTREQINAIPFKFSSHMSKEHEHCTTYTAQHDGHQFAMCKHVPYRDGEPKGRAYCHYMVDGKLFDKTLPNNFEHGLSVDYHPCQKLHDILKEAGVDDRDIGCIVPIKTSLGLRDFDKSLVGTSGYRNFVDL